MKKMKNRGISIAEMCIVLAVIAVASVVIVSFTLMVSARSAASVTKLNAYNDIEVSQVILENWMDQMLEANLPVVADESGLRAVDQYVPENIRLHWVRLEDGILVAELPDGEQLTCPITTVKEFRFSQLPAEATTEPVLYFCTVVYEVQNPTGEYVPFEDTFTIMPRVGQTLS